MKKQKIGSLSLKDKIQARILNFFIEAHDFNGMPLRNVSKEFQVDYKESINIIKELVADRIVSIQSSTNPHIIYSRHYPIDIQLKILDDAKNITQSIENIGSLKFVRESTDYPICLYPSPRYLLLMRNPNEFGNAEYSKLLGLGEPQLSPRFFEIDVLERYLHDPRFYFEFKDYSGSISYNCDSSGNTLVRAEDEVFLKSFGLGFDENGNRLAVVYLRYLKGLTPEHQIYWKSKEVTGQCKMVEEYFDNTIRGEWTNSYSIFSAFIGELKCLNDLSERTFGTRLFLHDYDQENRPKEFTFFFTPTLKNYNEFVHLLDKMVSDNINRKFFTGKIDLFDFEDIENGQVERKQKGTLRLLEEWLLAMRVDSPEDSLKDLFRSLKNIRNARQSPAHKVSQNEYDKKYIDMQRKMICNAYSSIRALRKIFQQHLNASDFNIPKWLDDGEIKVF